MRLKEYEGKEIFKEHKIKIPKGFLIRNIKEINTSLLKKLKGNKVVIKAEVLVGSRGKAGGIRICEKKDIKTHCKDLFHRKIRGFKVKEILIEEYTKIKHEYYLSIVLNKNKKCLEILFSKKGGIDIETLSKKHPKEITKIFVKNNKFDKKQIKTKHKKELIILINKLLKITNKYETELVEINPLALTSKGLVALDSKMITDENALFRQPKLLDSKLHRLTNIEKKAYKYDLHYVELEGNIGVIGNGAGLVMATLDSIKRYGGSAANFLDAPGGTSKKAMLKSLEIIFMKKNLKSALINIFGGITQCDEVAEAIIEYKKKHKIKVPIIIRITGTKGEKARKLLKKARFEVYKNMDRAIKAVVKK